MAFDFAEYFTHNLWVYYAYALIVGLAIGSFLNVVIYRLPVMMHNSWNTQCRELMEDISSVPDKGSSEEQEIFNLVVPRSRCPKCGHLIGARENIPVLSYLLQGGKCRHCGAPISKRYPLVESFTALLTIAIAWQFGPSMQMLFALILTWSLIALTFIDLDHQLLPDDITLPLMWLGILLAYFDINTDLHSSVLGAIAGYLVLWSVFQLFRLLTGKEGMGHGDFKLLAALGAWLGWQALPAIILLSSLVGTIIGISMIMVRKHDKNVPIPFGPYLAMAGWLTLMWQKEITHAMGWT